METRDYRHSYEKAVIVNASPEAVFAALDEHANLASHMMKSSAMMAGQAMRFEFDEGYGRALGSKIIMRGRVLGLDFRVEEVVTDRVPPTSKVWETVGEPRLVVIDHYRMGFSIEPCSVGSRLTVFIAYRLPRGLLSVLWRVLGPIYARWCVDSMAIGAVRQFTAAASGEPAPA